MAVTRGKLNHIDNLIVSIFLSIFFFLAMWSGTLPHTKTPCVQIQLVRACQMPADPADTKKQICAWIQLAEKNDGGQLSTLFTPRNRQLSTSLTVRSLRLSTRLTVRGLRLSTAFTITVNSVYNQQPPAVYKVYNQQKETARQLSTKFTISRKRQLGSCLQSLQSAKKSCKLSLQGA